jgi:hypothetical protein
MTSGSILDPCRRRVKWILGKVAKRKLEDCRGDGGFLSTRIAFVAYFNRLGDSRAVS